MMTYTSACPFVVLMCICVFFLSSDSSLSVVDFVVQIPKMCGFLSGEIDVYSFVKGSRFISCALCERGRSCHGRLEYVTALRKTHLLFHTPLVLSILYASFTFGVRNTYLTILLRLALLLAQSWRVTR